MSDGAVTFSGPWTFTTFEPVDAIGLLTIELEGTDGSDGRWILQTRAPLPALVTGELWQLSPLVWVDAQSVWLPFSCLISKSFSRTEGLTVDLLADRGVIGVEAPPTLFLRCVSTDPDLVVETPPFFNFGIPDH